MADLSIKAAHQYWFNYRDPMIYKVLAFMEGVEDWTLDGDPALEEALTVLGNKLDDIGNVNMEKEDDFIKLALNLKASRMLLLLQYLDLANPGTASKILVHSEKTSYAGNDVPGLFLRRNVVFERLRLLGRILAPQRLELVIKALENDLYA